MPRPGPRPYECVRRAWHSDRHQPMRGSLIQEIFRIANEIHSISTKKNKEWQEKLPIVVLKAEEIMYSKANSEAEYADLKTLWGRTHDAINTIIRLDESTETGDLLQPCIEAALNLGCTPRKASRSQRNNNPTCYLNPAINDPRTFSPVLMHNSNNMHSAIEYSNFGTSMIGHLNHVGMKSQTLGCQNNDFSSNSLQCATDSLTLPKSSNGTLVDHCMSSLWSVYPLVYESCLELKNNIGSVIKSVPSTSMPPRAGVSRNLFCEEDASVKVGQVDCDDSTVNCCAVDCDLSLRLGSLFAPSQIVENRQLQDFKDFGSGCFDKENKINDQTSPMNKNILFFPWVNGNDQFDACSSNFNIHDSMDVVLKKRKAVFPHNLKDQASYWQSKLPCNKSTGRMKNSDL